MAVRLAWASPRSSICVGRQGLGYNSTTPLSGLLGWHQSRSAAVRFASAKAAAGGKKAASNSGKRTALSFMNAKGVVRACGIVGVPNVGKSTLFNALTSSQRAKAENYPFCTIDPNIARVPVPDARLQVLADIAQSQRVIAPQLEFVDIAGLVAGASKGEGMGNKFLLNIRGVNLIIHMVRCFKDEKGDEIIHVSGSVDPLRDLDVIATELILADMESLMRIKDKKSKDKTDMKSQLVDRTLAMLDEGKAAHMVELTEEEWPTFNGFQLLTAKPALYVCNVKESEAATGNEMVEQVRKKVGDYYRSVGVDHVPVVVISARLESEVALMEESGEGKEEFLQMYGLQETGLPKIIAASRAMLGQQTYFTVGPEETKGWCIPRGCTAAQAAGVIHSDFEKGFIRAEITAYQDFVDCGSEKAAKEAGKTRTEGASYVMRDGDICFFHFR